MSGGLFFMYLSYETLKCGAYDSRVVTESSGAYLGAAEIKISYEILTHCNLADSGKERSIDFVWLV